MIDAERDLTVTLASEPAGREVLVRVLDEIAAGRMPLIELVRNLEVDPERAIAQRRRIHALRRAARRGSIRAVATRAADLRLHARVIERMHDALRVAPATPEITLALARATAAEYRAEQAKQLLVESNLRLVIAHARRYGQRGFSFLDLVQEGNIGLMHAVDKFDPRRGYRLTTYASWWIKQSIERAIADRAATIRVPVHLHTTKNRVLRAQRRLVAEGSPEPTAARIAARAGIATEKVEQILSLPREPVSLDVPILGTAELMLRDSIVSDAHVAPDEAAHAKQRRERLKSLLRTLDDRERRVLTMRFGLDGSPDRTLAQVGEVLSLTRERIRQIEASALRKLRERCVRRGVRFDLDD